MPTPHLTPRECEVMDLLVVEQLSTEQIACRLGISPRTVKAHMSNIREKYDAASTPAAAYRLGFQRGALTAA